MIRSGCLYVVATPIGNLEDVSRRAVRTLEEVDLIACEDTRNSGRFLKHLDIATPMVSYHEHNEEARSAELLERLREGTRIALISDAGTPLLSDPGYRLVSLCRREGVSVISIPGPCAVTAALSISGLPTDQFYFVGFLPKNKGGQVASLTGVKELSSTLAFYLPIHSALRQLDVMVEILGDRQAFMVREMTKLHETAIYAPLSQIRKELTQNPLKGEITLLVSGRDAGAGSREPEIELDIHAYLDGLMRLRGLSASEAVRECVEKLGVPRKKAYKASLEIKNLGGE